MVSLQSIFFVPLLVYCHSKEKIAHILIVFPTEKSKKLAAETTAPKTSLEKFEYKLTLIDVLRFLALYLSLKYNKVGKKVNIVIMKLIPCKAMN
jgi:hypothetical protein